MGAPPPTPTPPGRRLPIELPVDASPQALLEAGRGALEAGRFLEAARAFRRLAAARPDDPAVWADLGLACFRAHELDAAAEALQLALALDPRLAIARLNLARVRLHRGDAEGARAACEEVLEDDPTSYVALALLGYVRESEGEADAAEEAYRAAQARDPRAAAAWCGLARLGRLDDPAPLAELLAGSGLGRADEAALRFALGSVLDRRGEHDRAFGCFARANGLRRSAYDPDARDALVERTLAASPPGPSDGAPGSAGDPTSAPVFVVGFPRSGTSLVEAVLAAHPAVRALGERPDLGLVARDLTRLSRTSSPFPEGVTELTAVDAVSLGRRYLASVGGVPPGVSRIVDKAPGNFLFLGLAGRILPGARVVHCVRDPRDTCLSCFFQDFGDHGGVQFAGDREHLARHYRGYRRLMEHWEAVRPLPILEVRYEELVADPERGIREVLAFLELPFDEACLSFDRTRRAVVTASSLQVREPMHTRSVGRWRSYAAHLGPLADLVDSVASVASVGRDERADDASDEPPAPGSPDTAGLRAQLQRAEALLAVGDTGAAGPVVHAILADRPREPEGLALRARLKLAAGDAEGAVLDFVESIAVRRDRPWVWRGLGAALEPLGRWSEALQAYEEAARLATHDAEVHKDLARALVKNGRLADALAALRRAVGITPNVAEYRELLGLVLQATERADEAHAELRRAVELDPNRPLARFRLGVSLAERGAVQEALVEMDRAHALDPASTEYARELGRVATLARDLETARRASEHVLTLEPDDAVSHVVLGTTWELEGWMDRAEELYRRALDLDPDQVLPYYKLARAGRFDDESAIEARCARGNLTPEERAELDFAAAEIRARRNEAGAAFERYAEGNRRMRATVAYDRDRHRALVRRIVAATPPQLFPGNGLGGDDGRREASELPVFVVGMPRSGTSLVEQVLASHPDVAGIGEHWGLEHLARSLETYPEALAGLVAEETRRLAARYLASFESPGPGVARVVDKAPGNFHHLGLAGVLLPRARVVHVRRDPRDTCLSCFFTDFGKNRCTFSYDLQDLAAYYEDYLTLMEHWRAVLPRPWIEVEYEALVADPEGQTRRLLEGLELPWDPACLEFHRSHRPVFTASAGAVREPMHARSVGRWRRYEEWIGPLARLGDGVSPADGVSTDRAQR